MINGAWRLQVIISAATGWSRIHSQGPHAVTISGSVTSWRCMRSRPRPVRQALGLLRPPISGFAHHLNALRNAANPLTESIGALRGVGNGADDLSRIDLLEAATPRHLHSEHLAATRARVKRRRCPGEASDGGATRD